MRHAPLIALATLLLVLHGVTLAQEVPTPDGRYICYQGGLTSTGSTYFGYVDLAGDTYRPLTGTGGTYTRDAEGLLAFHDGIYEHYDWVGVPRLRDDGITEIVLLERADLEAFRAGRSDGGGSGYTIYCGWNGTR